MAFDFKGTLNQSQFNRFLAFAQAQLPDVAARLNHLAVEQSRLGVLAFSYDANGQPLAYSPQPANSYLGKLLASYEILGGDAFYDLNIRSMSQAVYLVRADETRPAQLMSNGEIVGTPGLGDRGTAELMDTARGWMADVLFSRREYLERKIRRCIDYGDQLQAEQNELLNVVADADQEGSLGYVLAEIQALIEDPTYRPAYDDQGADPHGKLTGAPLLPYSAGPKRTAGDVYGKDSGDRGVVKPGEGGQ